MVLFGCMARLESWFSLADGSLPEIGTLAVLGSLRMHRCSRSLWLAANEWCSRGKWLDLELWFSASEWLDRRIWVLSARDGSLVALGPLLLDGSFFKHGSLALDGSFYQSRYSPTT
jgi:hypothetical protein